MASDWEILHPRVIEMFLDEVSARIQVFAKEEQIAESKHPDGGLSEQWTAASDGSSIILANSADYASEWLYGRGPISKWGTKEWLHWVDPENGADVFAKYVGPSLPHTEFIPQLEYWLDTNADSLLQRCIDAEGG